MNRSKRKWSELSRGKQIALVMGSLSSVAFLIFVVVPEALRWTAPAGYRVVINNVVPTAKAPMSAATKPSPTERDEAPSMSLKK